jgi:adenosylcobinamide-GDP ribazoletransferase
MGDSFRRGLTGKVLVVASVVAVAAAAPLLLWGLVVWAASAVACVVMALVAMAKLGGLTGDVYGAVVELAETLALVALCFL